MHFRSLMLLLPLLLAACGDAKSARQPQVNSGPPAIQCVSYPLYYLTRRLAPDVDVRLEVPKGEDPAFWKPSGESIRAFQGATLIIANGAGYANWMKTATLPTGRLVDTSAGFKDRLIETSGGVTHSHGPGGDHTHGDVAFTTWLDLDQCAAQARAISAALQKAQLGEEDARSAALKKLTEELESLHAELRKIGEAAGRQPLLASHPVYQYLARAYDLNIKSEHFDPKTVPSDEELAIVASMHKVFPAKWMLWEAEPLPETRKKLKAIGIGSVVFDPCANRPESGDFLSVMKENIARLRKALQP